MNVAIRGWTLTHWWVRPVVKIWFDIYHKSVIYSGTDHIDWNKPIIFAPSHRNAYSDALCLILPTSYTENRFIYPLIRADAFGQSKLLDWMLTSFHMFPVYRPRDTVNLKQKNEDVFARCHQLLAQNRNLLIHPEGNCIPLKKVRPFKKGLARIALGAERYQFDLGVNIIPVGINYRDITAPRQGIHVHYGDPLRVVDFKQKYQKNAAAGIKKLTKAIRSGVKKAAVDIPKGSFYSLYDDLLTLNRNWNFPYCNRQAYELDELRSEQQIVRALNELHKNNETAFHQKKQQLRTLKKNLQRQGMTISQSAGQDLSLSRLSLKGAAGILLAPITLYGLINNIIPWGLMNALAKQVGEKQFISSARMTLGLVFFPFFYVVQTLIVVLFSHEWGWSFLYLCSLPLSGLITLHWKEQFRQWKQDFYFCRMPQAGKEEIRRRIGQLFTDLF